MSDTSTARRYRIVDFSEVPGVACPCGTARRAFQDIVEFPATVHVTEISEDAALHYHKTLTETYYFLECGPGAQMQLDAIHLHGGVPHGRLLSVARSPGCPKGEHVSRDGRACGGPAPLRESSAVL